MQTMSKKIVEFIKKVDYYIDMNKVVRFFRGDHIRRDV